MLDSVSTPLPSPSSLRGIVLTRTNTDSKPWSQSATGTNSKRSPANAKAPSAGWYVFLPTPSSPQSPFRFPGD
jgi:hypothetical protein